MTILDTPITTVEELGIEHSIRESDSTIQLHGTVVLTSNRHRAFERYSIYLDLDSKGTHVFEILFAKADGHELFDRAKTVSKGSTATVGVGVMLMSDGTRLYRARDLTLDE
jgi:hypothetical protein